MEVECILHCQCGCREIVYREPVTNEGVYLNQTRVKRGECPDCGKQMVRE